MVRRFFYRDFDFPSGDASTRPPAFVRCGYFRLFFTPSIQSGSEGQRKAGPAEVFFRSLSQHGHNVLRWLLKHEGIRNLELI